jgi:hypothetical protein
LSSWLDISVFHIEKVDKLDEGSTSHTNKGDTLVEFWSTPYNYNSF